MEEKSSAQHRGCVTDWQQETRNLLFTSDVGVKVNGASPDAMLGLLHEGDNCRSVWRDFKR
jgi:hypothetical protein